MQPSPTFLLLASLAACVPGKNGAWLDDTSGTGAAPPVGGETDTAAEGSGLIDPSISAPAGSGLDDLPVYPCPGPPDGATVLPAITFEAWQTFYGRGVAGYYLEVDGVNYLYRSVCPYTGWTDAVFDGSIPGAAYFDLTVTLPYSDDPIDFQGDYPVVAGAETWGGEPYESLLVGWYQDGVGYDLVTWDSQIAAESDLQTIEFCLSRVRPNRISGTALYQINSESPIFDPHIGPFYITFDGVSRASNAQNCVGSFYEDGASQDSVWDDDVNTP